MWDAEQTDTRTVLVNDYADKPSDEGAWVTVQVWVPAPCPGGVA
jgi:hypothetical protein